jgi:hypothetical protein
MHPNLLFISWMLWVPAYVRSELKKKTGIVINEYGQKMDENGEISQKNNGILSLEAEAEHLDDFKNLGEFMQNQQNKGKKKEYTPIKSYKPSGNLVYDDELLSKIGDKFQS